MKSDSDLYRFNFETLSYEKIKNNTVRKFLITGCIILIVTLALNFRFLEYNYLKLENKQLKKDYLVLNDKISIYKNDLLKVNLKQDSIYRAFLNMQIPNDYVKQASNKNEFGFPVLNAYSYSDSIIEIHKKVNELLVLIEIQNKSYSDILKHTNLFITKKNSIPSINPIKFDYLNKQVVTSNFGLRLHPILNTVRMHNGIDLSAPIGTGVYSSGDGVVIKVGNDLNGLGNYITIDHQNGYKTIYGHLSSTNVVENQVIKQGDIIGLVGSTGLSTNPHLHYSVLYNDIHIDPINYFGNVNNSNIY